MRSRVTYVTVQQRLARQLRTEYALRFEGESGSARGPGFDRQLGSGFCEISFTSSPPIDDGPALIYCNLISPLFVGDSTVRSMRTFIFPWSSCPVITSFQTCIMCLSSSADFRTFESSSCGPRGRTSPSMTARRPQRWWVIFEVITSGKRRNCIKRGVAIFNRTFITMRTLDGNYLNQAGRALTTPGIGPVYAAPLHIERGTESAFFRHSLPLGPLTPVEWGQGSVLNTWRNPHKIWLANCEAVDANVPGKQWREVRRRAPGGGSLEKSSVPEK